MAALSLSGSAGDSRFVFTAKNPLNLPSWPGTCSHPSPVTGNKSHRASLSGTGAVFALVKEMVLYTKHSTCVTETYLVVQEPHETTKGLLLMSSPWSSPTDPNEGTELEREERPT